jgi:hypothetical protein
MSINGALRFERQSEFLAICGCLMETPIAWLRRGSGLSHGNILANRIHTIFFKDAERDNISTIHIGTIRNLWTTRKEYNQIFGIVCRA